jgi:hypothetical protein
MKILLQYMMYKRTATKEGKDTDNKRRQTGQVCIGKVPSIWLHKANIPCFVFLPSPAPSKNTTKARDVALVHGFLFLSPSLLKEVSCSWKQPTPTGGYRELFEQSSTL